MFYTLLADLMVAIHVGYVAYVVLGQLLIFLGAACGWRWVRNPWFRWTHLAAILIVAGEAVADIRCPLTVWEDQLRSLGGQAVTEGTFLGRWMHALLFYDLPTWAFTAMYVGFAVLVLGTLVLVPPRLRTTAHKL